MEYKFWIFKNTESKINLIKRFKFYSIIIFFLANWSTQTNSQNYEIHCFPNTSKVCLNWTEEMIKLSDLVLKFDSIGKINCFGVQIC